jgi:hypothetical protein
VWVVPTLYPGTIDPGSGIVERAFQFERHPRLEMTFQHPFVVTRSPVGVARRVAIRQPLLTWPARDDRSASASEETSTRRL